MDGLCAYPPKRALESAFRPRLANNGTFGEAASDAYRKGCQGGKTPQGEFSPVVIGSFVLRQTAGRETRDLEQRQRETGKQGSCQGWPDSYYPARKNTGRGESL